MQSVSSAVQSVDRVFSILELLSENPKGMSLSEICQESGLPKGTASRMLSSLIAHRYAMQDIATKKYCLTLKLFEIGSRVVDKGMNILSIARPYLEQLASVSGEAVHLVVRDKDQVLYLYKEESTSSVLRMSSCVGMHSPMDCTGVGKSILAYLPEEETRAIWDRTEHVKYTKTTIMDYEKMKAEMEEIRKNGYALDREEHEIGVFCIAAPIFDFYKRPIAAISISAPAGRLNQDKIDLYAPYLLESTKKIGAYFG